LRPRQWMQTCVEDHGCVHLQAEHGAAPRAKASEDRSATDRRPSWGRRRCRGGQSPLRGQPCRRFDLADRRCGRRRSREGRSNPHHGVDEMEIPVTAPRAERVKAFLVQARWAKRSLGPLCRVLAPTSTRFGLASSPGPLTMRDSRRLSPTRSRGSETPGAISTFATSPTARLSGFQRHK
jgi:hypothetical protein